MESSGRSFWKRPEGTFAKVFIGALVIFGAFMFVKFLPLLLAIVANTMQLAIMCGILFGAFLLFTNGSFRQTFGLLFKTAMKFITSLIVKIDPIDILQQHVRKLENRLGEMAEQMGTVKGVTERLQRKLTDYKQKVEEFVREAKSAKAAGKSKRAKLAFNKADRRKKTYDKLLKLSDKITKMYNALLKMYENAYLITEDTKDQVESMKEEHKAIGSAGKALGQLKAILKGNADDELFNEAWEVAEDQIYEQIGQIDSFMDISKELLDSYDENADTFDESKLDAFTNWAESSEDFLKVDGLDAIKLEESVQMKKNEFQVEIEH